MKFKLDENFGRRCREVLAAPGHDVVTVAEQHLSGAADIDLLETCHREGRCLVTLDLDFSNPLRFPPAHSPGIAVIRLPARPGYADLLQAVLTLARALQTQDITGKLWIIEIGRLRIYRPETESD